MIETCNKQMCPVAGGGFLYCNAPEGHEGNCSHTFETGAVTHVYLSQQFESRKEMLKLLEAARHLLKSYEFGNSATEPAHDMAERIEQLLRKSGIEIHF